MKNKIIVNIFVGFFLLFAFQQLVSAQSVSSSEGIIKLRSFPKINDKLPISKREVKNSITKLMTGPASLEPSFEAEFDKIKFTLATNVKTRRITFISTTDTDFQTEEGIGMRDTLKEVLAVSSGKLVCQPGWGYFVTLKSGWNAAFVQGIGLTDGELRPDAKVAFLFKQ